MLGQAGHHTVRGSQPTNAGAATHVNESSSYMQKMKEHPFVWPWRPCQLSYVICQPVHAFCCAMLCVYSTCQPLAAHRRARLLSVPSQLSMCVATALVPFKNTLALLPCMKTPSRLRRLSVHQLHNHLSRNYDNRRLQHYANIRMHSKALDGMLLTSSIRAMHCWLRHSHTGSPSNLTPCTT